LPSGDSPQVDHHRLELRPLDPDHVEREGNVLAQRLQRAQHHRQSLALDGLADEDEPKRMLLGRHRGGGASEPIGHDDAVGDDPVVPAEEPLAGPGGGA
jgi:hypothetical protein